MCFDRSHAASSGQRLASASQPFHWFQKVTTNAAANQNASSQSFQLMCVYVSRLLSVSVYFTLKTINLQTVRHHELPDCYDFHIMVGDGVFGGCSAVVIVKCCGWEHAVRCFCCCVQILFNNLAHSGKITVDVGADVRIYECRDWNVEGTCRIHLKVLSVVTPLCRTITATDLQMCDFAFPADKNNYLLLSFDSVVMFACFVSLILCLRSIITGIQLQIVSQTQALTSARDT